MSMEYVNTYYGTSYKRGMLVEDQRTGEIFRVTSATSTIRARPYDGRGIRRYFHPLDLNPVFECGCQQLRYAADHTCHSCNSTGVIRKTWAELRKR